MHHRPGSTGRPTEEGIAMNTRLDQTSKTLNRFEEKKSATERRFSELYRKKNELSADKWAHATAVETEQRLASESTAETEELDGIKEALSKLGERIIAGDIDACEGIPAHYSRSKTLTASIQEKVRTLDEVRARIELLASNASKYDQIVILIDQMHAFFTKLNTALNGVLDEHELPPIEAE